MEDASAENHFLLLDGPALGGIARSGRCSLFFELRKPVLVSGHLHMLVPELKPLLSDFLRAESSVSFGFFASSGSNISLS